MYFFHRLEVGFVGHPSPRITWLRDGQEIMSCQDFQINTSPNKSFLWISQVYPEDTGLYQVRAENPFGMAECKGSLTVQGERGTRWNAPTHIGLADLDVVCQMESSSRKTQTSFAIDGLMQKRCKSGALALELHLCLHVWCVAYTIM